MGFLNHIEWIKISNGIFAIIIIFVFIYSLLKYREVVHIEKEIHKLELEFDSIPQKSKNPYINNNQLIRIIEVKREPITRKIYLLKQERQFKLDKIPIVNLLRNQ